jgi:zinc transporter ZupT
LKHTFREVFWSVLGILVSGIAGGVAGWALFNGLDLPRVLNAVLAAIAGMVVATAVWLAITLFLRRIGLVP